MNGRPPEERVVRNWQEWLAVAQSQATPHQAAAWQEWLARELGASSTEVARAQLAKRPLAGVQGVQEHHSGTAAASPSEEIAKRPRTSGTQSSAATCQPLAQDPAWNNVSSELLHKLFPRVQPSERHAVFALEARECVVQ